MSAVHHTHNRTTDAIRAAYQAQVERRPVIASHDLQSTQQIVDNSIDWLREAYRLVKARPDLSQYIERAAASMKALQLRLVEEGAQGKAGAI